MPTYREKLLDPRWQKKRLKIFERDDFACQQCGDKNATLHIHHCIYLDGVEPWDHDDSTLLTLCASCHSNETVLEAIGYQGQLTNLRVLGYTNLDAIRISYWIASLSHRAKKRLSPDELFAVFAGKDADHYQRIIQEHVEIFRRENGLD